MEQRMVGRYREWSSLSRAWNSKKCFLISGLRSVGKSRFVNEFMKYQQESKVVDVKTVWVDVKRCLSKLTGICTSVFRAIEVTPPEDESTWVETICNVVAREDNRDFVFVFDDAEDIIEGTAVQDFEHICKCLIQFCRNVKIIITSTTELICHDITNDWVSIPIPPLSPDESRELLQRIAPTVDFGPHLHTIVKLCEGLPLVIAMTASELSGVDGDGFPLMTVEEMSLALQACRLEALSPFMYSQSERIDTIYGTFLQRLPVTLQTKLASLGYIPGTFTLSQIKEMVGDVNDEDAMSTTLDPLMRRHMMKQDNITERYDIQGILRLCIDDLFNTVKNSPGVRQKFCKLFGGIMVSIGSMLNTSKYVEALCEYNHEQQNFQKLLTDVELIYTNEDIYCVYMEIAINASNVIQQFMGADGFMFYQELLRLSSRLNKMDEACVQLCYGGALTNVKGNMTEGEKKYRLAIEYLENHLHDPMVSLSGCYHGLKKDMRYHLATSYQRMGWNLFVQARTTEAIIYLEKAFKLENELNLYLEELVLGTLMSLGITHNLSGNTTVALRYHDEALKRRTELYKGENHHAIGGCYNNKALTYRNMGLCREALDCFERALVIKKKFRGPPKTIAISIINVASSLSQNGRHDEGLQRLQEAREILNKTPGLYQDIIALVYATEGQILLRKNLYKQSIQLFDKSLGIRKRSTPNNVWSAETYHDLAKAYLGLNKCKHALYWFNQVFALHEALMSDAPTSTFVFECYSEVLRVLADLKKREELLIAYNAGMNELHRVRKEFVKLGNTEKIEWVDEQIQTLPSTRNDLLQEYFSGPVP